MIWNGLVYEVTVNLKFEDRIEKALQRMEERTIPEEGRAGVRIVSQQNVGLD